MRGRRRSRISPQARRHCRSSRCGCSASSCSPAARCCRAMSGAPCSARLPTSRRSMSLNHEMGTDRPLLVQYGDWIAGFRTGDMGHVLCLPRAGRAVSRHGACRTRPSWRRWHSCWWCRSAFSAACMAALYRGPRRRPDHHGRRHVGHHRAGIRLGHRADPDLRRLAALAADLGHLAARAGFARRSSTICSCRPSRWCSFCSAISPAWRAPA